VIASPRCAPGLRRGPAPGARASSPYCDEVYSTHHSDRSPPHDALLHSPPMTLSEPQKKHLRGLGHALKPVVMVGDSGLSDAVIAELNVCLDHHELVKVRVKVGDRQDRDDIIAKLCTDSSATLVQRTGNMALLYRENSENREKKIRLPGER